MRIGIEAIAVEIPYHYVLQKELEIEHKCVGKYTQKMGMDKIAVPGEKDISSSIFGPWNEGERIKLSIEEWIQQVYVKSK